MDELDIPDFLRRTEETAPAAIVRRRREKKIAYPKDGYLGKGLRKAARERLRSARQRHAEKCRVR